MTAKWRILAVDDEPDVRLIIRSTLEPKYEVVEAHDGLDALEKIERYQPDFVLMDVMMPLMDGFESCAAIRRKEQYKNLPVMFLTALTGKENIKKGYESGADLYLTKPFEPSRLLRNVDLFFEGNEVPEKPRRYSIEQIKDAEKQQKEPLAPGAGEYSSTPAPAAATATPTPEKIPHGQKPRVMIVDDDPEVRDLMDLSLHENYEVVSAVDGMQAIEKLVRYQPDILVLDIMLPRMNGIQLCQSLRANRAFAKMPILICSAKGSVKDQNFAKRVGADDYLVKPFDPPTLREKVGELHKRQGYRVRPKSLQYNQIAAMERRSPRSDVFKVGKEAREERVSGATWLGPVNPKQKPASEPEKKPSPEPAPPKEAPPPPAASGEQTGEPPKKKKRSFFGFRKE